MELFLLLAMKFEWTSEKENNWNVEKEQGDWGWPPHLACCERQQQCLWQSTTMELCYLTGSARDQSIVLSLCLACLLVTRSHNYALSHCWAWEWEFQNERADELQMGRAVGLMAFFAKLQSNRRLLVQLQLCNCGIQSNSVKHKE